MPLILAIEPDKRQSSQLTSVVKGLHAELVLRPNAADALGALNGRVPDLVLTTSLISPRDDAALATHLRELGPAAAHVQTVSIPVLGSAAAKPAKIGGMLAALRREKPPQAPMTDGCAPEVFAEQVRQYLATAEEQKAVAATRATAVETVAETATESLLVEDAVTEAAFADEFVAPVEEVVTPAVEPEPEPVLAEAVAPVELPIAHAIEERVVPEIEMEAAAPEPLVVDEPESVPLSQLLQFVSAASPAISEEPVAEAPIPEPVVEPEPVVLAAPAVETAPVIEAAAFLEAAPVIEAASEVEAPTATSFSDLYVDPMAAEALEELSRQAPPVSLSDGIPAEAPVPVVEMHSFQSLDAIASELAAGPTHRHESLEDLASFFAATPTKPAAPAPVNDLSGPVVDFSAPMHGEKNLFASLFAEPAPARAPKPVEIPGIDPTLFASPAPAPEPEPEPEPVLAAAPEPEPEPEPIAAAPEPEPVVPELAAAPAIEESVIAEPVIAEPVVAEPVTEAPVVAEVVALPVLEEEVVEEAPAEDELLTFEPVVFEPVVAEPVAAAAPAPTPDFDEEISLDVDAFQYTPPAPAAPAEPARFSFTLVEGGFGDAMSDFEVPSVAAVAADLGVGEHPPLDPYASKPAATPAAVREALNEPAAAPALDEEALSLIGDAARKVGLDALVIEEFERGLNQPRPKKAKKKVHAGATQVPAAPAPAAKPAKRPVQDEWGMFDPEQCGFAALEDEEGEARPTTGTRVRVISY